MNPASSIALSSPWTRNRAVRVELHIAACKLVAYAHANLLLLSAELHQGQGDIGNGDVAEKSRTSKTNGVFNSKLIFDVTPLKKVQTDYK